MNKLGFFVICLLALPLELFCDPAIINYGYNKFIPSPYSKKIVVIPFDSTEGIQVFQQSQYKKAFFKLAPHYAPQQSITNCGISSDPDCYQTSLETYLSALDTTVVTKDKGLPLPRSYRQ